MLIYNTNKSIFEIPTRSFEAVCVTTNGIVKNNGDAVMGAGIAKECANLFPDIPRKLGNALTAGGNRVYDLGLVFRHNREFRLYSFPTKSHWKEDSDINLIRKSCVELSMECSRSGIMKCYLPKPGCNNGHLDWESVVKPVISEILDDRFVVIDRESYKRIRR